MSESQTLQKPNRPEDIVRAVSRVALNEVKVPPSERQESATSKVGAAKVILIRKRAGRPAANLGRERVLKEEALHLPCRVRPARIGVRAGGTATRPGVTGAVNVPMLGDGAPSRIGQVRAGVGVSMGHS
jgi:hypothetical protein